jgi:hypothetical protein
MTRSRPIARVVSGVLLVLALLPSQAQPQSAQPYPPYPAPPPPQRVWQPPVVDPNPPPLSPAVRVIYAPFYAAGLVLRYGLYYLLVAPLEVFSRTLSYGVEGGVRPPVPPPPPPPPPPRSDVTP